MSVIDVPGRAATTFGRHTRALAVKTSSPLASSMVVGFHINSTPTYQVFRQPNVERTMRWSLFET